MKIVEQVVGPHCEQCGSTEPEDIDAGYSACCNEPVVVTCDGDCSHE